VKRWVAIWVLCVGCRDPNRVPLSSSVAAPILLFDGAGTSSGDVEAIEAILGRNHLTYSTVDGSQLSELPPSRLAEYRLLIVPGGNFMTMGQHLDPVTATKIHDAVQSGVSYLGICAGGYLAGALEQNGFNLTSGVQFRVYAEWNRGVRKTSVAIKAVGSPALDQYWEEGPEFTGWGDVVARYPDGTPAVVEGTSGKGWVVLVGVHPEAPPSWRDGLSFKTPASSNEAYAVTLIDAALNRRSLPHE
jgi:glutamine amidotransferase-like uncharacterized protein